MTLPSAIYLYRITHIDNLPFIVRSGEIRCPSHSDADPGFIGIGDNSLIEHRKTMPVPLEPGGTLNDYVAFYFTKRSPMLYNIRHGYQNVTKRPQEEIIYLVTSFGKVITSGRPYIIYDGHAYHRMSRPFNSEAGLSHIDWRVIDSNTWFDTEVDPDRKRRKQAELLVYRSLPFDSLQGIATFSERACNSVKNTIGVCDESIKVFVRKEWYY